MSTSDSTAGRCHAGPGDAEARHHARSRLLGTVRTEGMPALAWILLEAVHGDPVACELTVGELLRALPTANVVGAHDLLTHAGIREGDRVCDLDAIQRSSLATRVAHLHGARGWES
jgi:hypothetical protein